MSNLIYIMGKSSSGKDTIYQKLVERMETNSYVLYTTRPMRDGEQEGREYYFISNEKYKELEDEGKVIEARHYNVINAEGNKDVWTYATIDDEQWDKKGDFITIGSIESYNSLKEYLAKHPERNLHLLPIYIQISEEERRVRAIKRENEKAKPNFEEMERRLKADNIDFSDEKLAEAGITINDSFENEDLDFCVNEIIRHIDMEIELRNGQKFEKLHLMPTKYNIKQREEIRSKEKEILTGIKNKEEDGEER
ncbi:MAG: guanylate kinase [Clostridia bacterium]|nr:guanylate kinase [Clostridia bacterium]